MVKKGFPAVKGAMDARAEKIRTYRAKENLAVDHRLSASFNLDKVLGGDLQPMVDALIELETAKRLADL